MIKIYLTSHTGSIHMNSLGADTDTYAQTHITDIGNFKKLVVTGSKSNNVHVYVCILHTYTAYIIII